MKKTAAVSRDAPSRRKVAPGQGPGTRPPWRALLLIALLGPGLAAGQTVKKIYIANDDHTDYMWSANQDEHRKAFLEMLDYYLNLVDGTAKEASEYQSRFSCDGSYWAWVYEKNRTKAEFDRLMSRVQSGHITLPLSLLNLCYGAMPAEAVIRSMYYAGRLERRYGLRFPLATSQENQTLPYGVGALWAGAGAQYSWKGICGCASRVPDAADRTHDIYWWVGPDGSRILMKWNSMLRGNADMGGYAEARDPSGVIRFVDTNAEFQSRYPYRIIGAFGYGWDDLKSLTDAFVTAAKQATTADRKVIVSNEVDFFRDFEAQYGALIPSQSVSFGNEWDLLSASMAEVSSRVKRSVEKLRTAEALAALVSLQDPLFMRSREVDRDSAWIDLGLYYEHDWTADGPISRDARALWQKDRANGIETYVRTLARDAGQALGRMIGKTGSNPRLYVFNPLGWTRTDIADFPYSGSDQVHIVDLAAASNVSFQIVTVDGLRQLRILAENVPSTGYKVFEIAPGTVAPPGSGPVAGGTTIENSVYKITMSGSGAVSSLVDKTRGNREFVRSIGGRWLNDPGSNAGPVEIENAGPVSATLKATSPGPLAHTSRITLIRDSRRIEIQNVITQNFSTTQTWSFGFAIDSPEVRHEEIGAVIKAKPAEQGGHYASRNTRYDWLSLNHFADIQAGPWGVTLSSPDLSFMKLGASTTAFLDSATPQLSILAGGQVDGPSLGIPAQGGDASFLQRFALQTHDAFDPAAAMRFSMEHQNPLVTGEVTGGSAYPEKSYSLIEFSNPNVLLWSLKPAEDTADNRISVRFWNLSPAPADMILRLSGYSILEAERTTHIETPIETANFTDAELAAPFAGQQWQTFSLRLNGETAPGKAIGRKKIR